MRADIYEERELLSDVYIILVGAQLQSLFLWIYIECPALAGTRGIYLYDVWAYFHGLSGN